jgi:hypothetical protein
LEVVWDHEEVPVKRMRELWYGLWRRKGVATDPLCKINGSYTINFERMRIKAGKPSSLLPSVMHCIIVISY